MKYCKQCKKIYALPSGKCPQCKKELQDITEINTPVYLTTACGFDRSRIEGVLNDNKIIYSETPEKDETGAASLVGSYNENYRILVPFQAYTAAKKLLCDIGIEIESDISDEDIDKLTAELKSKSSVSEPNRAVTITLMFICLLLIAGAVLLTDTIIAWIQGLF